MKRSIVQHGSSSLTVSLPYSWAKKYGLKKGDEVDVVENSSSIIISAAKNQASSKITFNVDDQKKFLWRYVISLYKQGYDEIEVVSKDGLPFPKINEGLREVLGLEIIEQGKNKCVLRNVAQAVDSEFDPMLRRLFLLTISMGDECFDSIKNKEFERLADISASQYTTNKIANLCQRILNKIGYKDTKKTNYMNSIVDQIEQLGDHYGDLSDYFNKNKVIFSNDYLNAFKETNELLKYSYEVFYNFNTTNMYELKKRTVEMNDKLLLMFSKGKGKEQVLLLYLVQIVERINHIGIFLIEI